MINLLPPQEKEILLTKKKHKIAIVLGLIVIIPLVAFALVLLSINFYALGLVNSQTVILQEAKKNYQTPEFLEFTDIITKSNAALKRLTSFYGSYRYMSQALKTITDLSSGGNLYFTSLSLSKDAMGNIKVDASGFSKTRDDLIAFQERLESNPDIKKVYFSPESWVDANNNNFQISFQIGDKK